MSDSTTLEKRTSEEMQVERTRSGRTYVPAVDIIEKPDELLLLADMPGARAETVDIQYERGELTLSARVNQRQAPETPWLSREYGIGDFHRRFQVGEGIDAEGIQAEMRDGVLTLHLPKSSAARTRKIEVKSV